MSGDIDDNSGTGKGEHLRASVVLELTVLGGYFETCAADYEH